MIWEYLRRIIYSIVLDSWRIRDQKKMAPCILNIYLILSRIRSLQNAKITISTWDFLVFVLSCDSMGVIFAIWRERGAPNGFFIMTKNMCNPLIHNLCLNIFSIEAKNREVGKLQSKGVDPQRCHGPSTNLCITVSRTKIDKIDFYSLIEQS